MDGGDTVSRVRVVGLPKDAVPQKLKGLFGGCGEITDCAVIRNKQNNRPRMAFLGFKDAEGAAKAVKDMNRTYYGTVKMSVEFATQIGGNVDKKKVWSQHTKRKLEVKEEQEAEKRRKVEEALEAANAGRKRMEQEAKAKKEAVKERGFQNFLEASKGTQNRKIWENDLEEGGQVRMEEDAVEEDGDAGDAASVASLTSEQEAARQAELDAMTDMDFFKKKQEPTEMTAKPKSNIIKEADIAGADDSIASNGAAATEGKRAPEKRKAPSDAASGDAAAAAEPSKKKQKRVPVRKNTLEIEVAPELDAETKREQAVETILQSGRLFVSNLPYTATEEELAPLMNKTGTVVEIHIPLTRDSKQSKGVAFVQYAIPEQAVEAYDNLQNAFFQGRSIVVDAGKANPYEEEEESTAKSSYKKMKELKEKAGQADATRWNTLFMSGDAVASALAKRLETDKTSLVGLETKDVATRLAMGEAHLTSEVREIFGDEGLDLSVMTDPNRLKKRSDRIILVKNLPKDTQVHDITSLFDKFGAVDKVVAPKEATIALVRFVTQQEAKVAFRKLAFRQFNRVPLFLEWAPVGAMKDEEEMARDKQRKAEAKARAAEPAPEPTPVPAQPAAPAPAPVPAAVEDADDIFDDDKRSLYVTNIAFSITSEDFERFVRANIGNDAEKLKSVRVAGGQKGYGFVQFATSAAAKRACAALQGKTLMQRAVNVDFAKENVGAKTTTEGCPEGCDPLKLTVKNVPFEAKREDIAKLFAAFSQVKSVRLPRKAVGASGAGAAKRPHRGFAFVEFTTPEEAVAAKKKLSNTHIYGRHLVLEFAKLGDAVGSAAMRDRD
eukprot:TRINITY_DN6523_c0_g2_i1.p1 TRINITY_DN6523_c0_g2~~TRINITY_DN6523_c0_g2_i1.p1  ORF type:complete len:835 (+),score=308.25 TRINITY_DN6523_c0_g2_i1:95-2599(+)